MLMAADLPGDVDALREIVLELSREVDTLKTFRAEVERLRAIIEALQRHRFGRRSEQLDPDQLDLCLEDVETALAEAEEARDKASRTPAARPRKTNRGSLPAHLERIEQLVDVEDKTCSCCGGALHAIGEDVSERLDVVPITFRVLVTRRPRYGCRSCESAIVQAPAPARIVEGGIPTEALIAQVLVSKYADHLPLYRQAQIYARQGIQLDRSTLADWAGRAAWYLRPLRDHVLADQHQWSSRRQLPLVLRHGLRRGARGLASLDGSRGGRRMSDENKAFERQARYVARNGMSSVEHLEEVIARARELLEAGEVVTPPIEENPFIPQAYPWQLSERRPDLPKRVWLGTVEDFKTGQGHSVYFAAGVAHDEDEFRRSIALELGPHLAHAAKAGVGVDRAPLKDMFLPNKLEAMLTGFDNGKDRPAVMTYLAKFYSNYS